MTIARKRLSAGAVATLSVILAGCVGGGGGGGGAAVRPAPTGVEGTWIDAQGTGLSTISGGMFSTVATDTGQKLAEGSYILTNPTSVQITGTSLIRQSPISFNCLLVSGNQLNCTSSAGQQFVLTRRA
ncbi:hypothetical protein ABMA32_20150 [Mesorhizobium sp. VNQ89]|uniref:hypothetical protein n=1 Tax=Mesorhizobium quangtriensis TaxID=3157709 RepID=UPI0032B72EA2